MATDDSIIRGAETDLEAALKLGAILDELDLGKSKGEINEDRRAERRHTYRYRLRVTVIAEDGTALPYPVQGRNLSANGFGFLSDRGDLEQSACTVMLKTLSGEVDSLPGRIVHINQIDQDIYSVGVRFDQPIVLSKYMSEDRAVQVDE